MRIFGVFLLIILFCENIFAIENPFQIQLQHQLDNNSKISTEQWVENIREENIREENFSKNIQQETQIFQMEFFEPRFDWYSDEGITKFVGVNIGLNNEKYEPNDLVLVHSKYIHGKWKLREEAKNALDRLAEDFYKKFKKPLKIAYAYRSFEDQQEIIAHMPKCVEAKFCALPGFSEHQLGLAVDISGLYSVNWKKNAYEWMRENAHKYGWHQSYRKGHNVDGYIPEYWHWRYVGVDLATELFEKNMTLTEFFLQEK